MILNVYAYVNVNMKENGTTANIRCTVSYSKSVTSCLCE